MPPLQHRHLRTHSLDYGSYHEPHQRRRSASLKDDAIIHPPLTSQQEPQQKQIQQQHNKRRQPPPSKQAPENCSPAGCCETPPLQRHLGRSRVRSLFVVVIAFLLLCLGWFVSVLSSGATNDDVREIDGVLAKFRLSEGDQERRMHTIKNSLRAHEHPASDKRLLIVGMVESLQELKENEDVLHAITSLCWLFAGDDDVDYTTSDPKVDVRILYKSTKLVDESEAAMMDAILDDDGIASDLETQLSGWGCRVNLEPDEIMWQDEKDEAHREAAKIKFDQLTRYKRLAKLRSFHRDHILKTRQHDYDIVLNADLDIVHLPPVLSLFDATERVVRETEAGAGSVVCANGFETWQIGSFRRQLFYDTMAAIDANGEWGYNKYTMNPAQVVRFAQNTFLRDILRKEPHLWPMQSCFGGVAFYDFETWATPECDYDQDRIKFVPNNTHKSKPPPSRQLRAVPPSSIQEQLSQFTGKWTMPSKYTLQGTPGGDACEHAVFQQCLYHHNRAHSERLLKIGIQPNLIIERQAAVLHRTEDVEHVTRQTAKVILFLTLISFLVFPLLKLLQRYNFVFYFQHKQQSLLHRKNAKRRIHVHMA